MTPKHVPMYQITHLGTDITLGGNFPEHSKNGERKKEGLDQISYENRFNNYNLETGSEEENPQHPTIIIGGVCETIFHGTRQILVINIRLASTTMLQNER